MRISIINGPNLNLLGSREPHLYGNLHFDDYLSYLTKKYPQCNLTYFQSNIEGEIINEIHRCDSSCDAIIINAGAYTHTSLAIADALKAIHVSQVIEVHISNVFAREEIRKKSFIAPVTMGNISGLGLKVYELAIISILLDST